MNIINAIHNIATNFNVDIVDTYTNANRMNGIGDALEEYIKDLFACGEDFSSVFSYTGNASNPPDIILRDGDAIEVKKVGSISTIQLNSSHPKDKLRASSTLISKRCRDCEEWEEKDIIYAIGLVKNNKIKSLRLVYGTEYCASEDVYLQLKADISDEICQMNNIHFSQTNEIGRVNKCDPLGITHLRIRGMWIIQHPDIVFDYIYTYDNSCSFDFTAIISDAKWGTFDNTELITSINVEGFSINDVLVKDPNDTAKDIRAKFIRFVKE